MSSMTHSDNVCLLREPEVVSKTRTQFRHWLEAEFNRHYHSLRNDDYRRFLRREHPDELVRYDAACEALKDAEFRHFSELQTLGLFLYQQVQLKEAAFRHRRRRLLAGLAMTVVAAGSLLAWHFGVVDLGAVKSAFLTVTDRVAGVLR
ncbi:TPA: hypothetical protein ACIAIE_001989 [Serratia fonticola]